MNRIKIVFIANYKLAGDSIALLHLLEELINHGIQPLVVIKKKGDLSKELGKREIPYVLIAHCLNIYPIIKSTRDRLLFIPRLIQILMINYIAIKKLRKIAIKFKVDLIHTNIGPYYIGHIVAMRLGIPHVWHIREYQDLDFDMHPIPSKSEFIHKLHCTNNYLIAISYGIFNHFGMQNNARIIYDGVMKKSQIQFVANKEKYFLFVGRLEDAKGISQLVDAFIEFAKCNKDHELYIAGTGENSFVSELHRKIDHAGITQRVHFLGFRDDVYNLMSQATALVVPSRCEGFGFITVESMFNGCLVIGNNSGGTKEILEKENLGILYSGQDELVTAMKTVVLNGIENYYPMIKKAQERAVDLYSQEQNGAAVYEYYNEILSGRN